MKIISILLMFLILGALFIISNQNLALKDEENFNKFADGYYIWLNSLFENGKTITSYVVNSNWLPETGQEER